MTTDNDVMTMTIIIMSIITDYYDGNKTDNGDGNTDVGDHNVDDDGELTGKTSPAKNTVLTGITSPAGQHLRHLT